MNFLQRYRLRKKLNRMAALLGGTLRYVRHNEFGITGSHRDFPYYTRPILNGKEPQAFVLSLRLNNPNQKSMRVEKGAFIAHETREWAGQAIEHAFGAGVTMHSNDLFFSAYFLDEANAARIGKLLALAPEAAFFVHGSELGCAVPLAAITPEMAVEIREQLCEVKAGLG